METKLRCIEHGDKVTLYRTFDKVRLADYMVSLSEHLSFTVSS